MAGIYINNGIRFQTGNKNAHRRRITELYSGGARITSPKGVILQPCGKIFKPGLSQQLHKTAAPVDIQLFENAFQVGFYGVF